MKGLPFLWVVWVRLYTVWFFAESWPCSIVYCILISLLPNHHTNYLLSTTFSSVNSLTITLNAGTYPTLRDQVHLTGTLALDTSSVYLQVAKGFLSDTSSPSNYMSRVAAVNSTAPRTLYVDKTKPTLQSWSMDMVSACVCVAATGAVVLCSYCASEMTHDMSDSPALLQAILSSQPITHH